MAKHPDLENPLELEMLNTKDFEKVESDTNDGPDTAAPQLEKKQLAQASIARSLEQRITQFYNMVKVLTLFLAPILILVFIIYNIYANPKKEVPAEVITSLSKFMTNQMGGNFSPMLEDPINSSSIQTSG
jgi:hypothetical protein